MLQSIHIKNFKSFREQTVNLGTNNVLVGPNMSGKSNFLDFFRFVKDLLFPTQSGVYGLQSAFNPRNGFAAVAWRGARDPLLSFSISGSNRLQDGELLKWNYDVEILGNYQWGNVQVNREHLEVIDSGGSHVLIQGNGQLRSLYAHDGRQISQTNDANRLALEYEMPGWLGVQLRYWIVSWRFYNLVPALMRRPNPTAASNSLTVVGDNLSAWLMLLQTRYSDSFERLRSVAKDVFPALTGLFTSPTPQSTVYLASSEYHLIEPITTSEMSDGELAFLAILSLLYAPSALGSDLYLIEEPENHLHPRLISTLIDLLRQVQSELGDDRGQVILTTHSPHLVDKFSIEELILVSKREGATVCSRASDNTKLREILSDEEIGLGDLYYSGALTIA